MAAQVTITLSHEQSNYLTALLYRDLMPASGTGGIAYNPVWVEAVPKPIVTQLQEQLPTWRGLKTLDQLNKVK